MAGRTQNAEQDLNFTPANSLAGIGKNSYFQSVFLIYQMRIISLALPLINLLDGSNQKRHVKVQSITSIYYCWFAHGHPEMEGLRLRLNSLPLDRV